MGKYILYMMLQCSWGGVQTVLGFLVFLVCWNCPHHYYKGAIHTEWKGSSGISLGMFLFTPALEGSDGRSRRMRAHEYGHTIQSLLLGPGYLLVIGLPSLVWSRSEWMSRFRAEHGLPYSYFYTERWADWLGTRLTGEDACGE